MSNLRKIATKDDDLESSLFTLAYDQIQSKLGKLLPYLVGFQVIKANNDKTRIVAAFCFKSDDNIVLVPVFFNNGNIKDINIIYSKNNEQFYPLSEEFAELFLKGQSTHIGDKAKETPNDIRADSGTFDVGNMILPPRTGKITTASLVEYVQEGSNQTKEVFNHFLSKNAEFLESVLRFHPMDKVAEALVMHKVAVEVKPESKLQVFTKSDLSKTASLNQDEKIKLATYGYLIKDARENADISTFSNVQYRERFSNPTSTGFYKYITSNGSLRLGFIMVRPKQLQQHFSTDDTIVMDLDSTPRGRCYVAAPKQVFVKDQVKFDDYSAINSLLEEPASVKPSFDSHYVLFNDNAVVTQPFEVVSNFKDNNDVRRIHVSVYHDYKEHDTGLDRDKHHFRGNTNRPGSVEELPKGNFYNHPKKKNDVVLVITKGQGNTLSYGDGLVYVPKGFKLLPVKLKESSYVLAQDTKGAKAKEVKEEAGKPGGLAVMTNALRLNNVFPVSVRTDGNQVDISVAAKSKTYNGKLQAKIGAVVDLGLTEKQASEVIDALKIGTTLKGYIKLAYTGDFIHQLMDEQPSANQLGQPTYMGLPYLRVQPTNDGYKGDPTALGLGDFNQPESTPPPDATGDVQKAVQTAQTGQKEVFDAQAIATLAKYVAPEKKITDYMPKLTSALDRLGRLLFLLNWDVKAFEEMFGRDDLPELNELLTSVFENLGDLIIFLKKHSPQLDINNKEKDNV